VSPPVRVLLAGAGRIARFFHLPILAALDGARLVAVADPDPEARALAARVAPGVATHADLDAALDAGGVDAVVVALPTALHAPAALAALERGLAVFVEKPLATSLAEAEPVLAAWRARGTVGAVGLNYRLHPAYADLRARLARGEAGRLVALRTAVGAAGRELPPWKTARATGGGVLLDLVSHHADLVPFLAGAPVVAARAEVRTARTEADTALVDLRLASGLVAQVFATLAGVEEDRVEAYGEEARLTVDRPRAPWVQRTAPRPPRSRRDRALAAPGEAGAAARRLAGALAPRPDPSFAAALAGFVAAVARGGPVAPDLEDGRRSLAVVEACERSLAGGGWVAVAEGAGARPAPQ